jgi:hypothetical protein
VRGIIEVSEKEDAMSMTIEQIAAQIEGIERQLAVLKAELKRLCPEKMIKSFADLHGIFPHHDFTEEEIDAVLYREPKWPEDDEDAPSP